MPKLFRVQKKFVSSKLRSPNSSIYPSFDDPTSQESFIREVQHVEVNFQPSR